MEGRRLYIDLPNHSVKFELKGYLTLVEDDSGKGKTFVCKLISAWVEYKNVKDVVVIKTIHDFRDFIRSKNQILFIIDMLEQWDEKDREEACNLIKKNYLTGEPVNHYFVIMYRAGIDVPFFMDDLYGLKVEKNKKQGYDFSLVQYFPRG